MAMESLPAELLDVIFRHAFPSFRQRARTALVSRAWRVAVYACTSDLDAASSWIFDRAALSALLPLCHSVRILRLPVSHGLTLSDIADVCEQSLCRPAIVSQLELHFQDVREDDARCDEATLARLSRRFPSLRSISFKGHMLSTSPSLFPRVLGMTEGRRLDALDLSCVPFDPSLTSAEDALCATLSAQPGLRSFSLFVHDHEIRVGPLALLSFARTCPLLESLCLDVASFGIPLTSTATSGASETESNVRASELLVMAMAGSPHVKRFSLSLRANTTNVPFVLTAFGTKPFPSLSSLTLDTVCIPETSDFAFFGRNHPNVTHLTLGGSSGRSRTLYSVGVTLRKLTSLRVERMRAPSSDLLAPLSNSARTERAMEDLVSKLGTLDIVGVSQSHLRMCPDLRPARFVDSPKYSARVVRSFLKDCAPLRTLELVAVDELAEMTLNAPRRNSVAHAMAAWFQTNSGAPFAGTRALTRLLLDATKADMSREEGDALLSLLGVACPLLTSLELAGIPFTRAGAAHVVLRCAALRRIQVRDCVCREQMDAPTLDLLARGLVGRVKWFGVHVTSGRHVAAERAEAQAICALPAWNMLRNVGAVVEIAHDA